MLPPQQIADNRNWLLGTECSLLNLQISSATWNPTNRNNLRWFEQNWISDSQIANNQSQGPLFLPPCWRWNTENFKLQIKNWKFQITNYESCASLDTNKDLTKAVWKKTELDFQHWMKCVNTCFVVSCLDVIIKAAELIFWTCNHVTMVFFQCTVLLPEYLTINALVAGKKMLFFLRQYWL